MRHRNDDKKTLKLRFSSPRQLLTVDSAWKCVAGLFVMLGMTLQFGCRSSEHLVGPGQQEAASDQRNTKPLQGFVVPEGDAYRNARGAVSYSHDLKGNLLPSAGRQPRNVFKASSGEVLSVGLAPIRAGIAGDDEVQVTRLTDIAMDFSLRVSLKDRKMRNVSFPPTGMNYASGAFFESEQPPWNSKPTWLGLQFQIHGGFDGPEIRLVVWNPKTRGKETATISVHELNQWRAERLLASTGNHVEMNGRKFVYEPAAVAEGQKAFVGLAYYDEHDLKSAAATYSPYYFVRFWVRDDIRSQVRQIAERIPIGDSGHCLVVPLPRRGLMDSELVHEKCGESVKRFGSLQDVYNTYKPAVVKISHGGMTGTGFVVTPSGDILSNQHVVEGAPDGVVTVKFADRTSLRGKVVRTHGKYDLALVQLDGSVPLLKAIDVAADPSVGEECLTIGHPDGDLEWSFVRVGIAGLNRTTVNGEGQTIRYLQLDGPINPGNSGGPVINHEGKLVGIAFAERARSRSGSGRRIQNVGLAVPIDVVRSFVDASKK